jgi:hypothetical protein
MENKFEHVDEDGIYHPDLSAPEVPESIKKLNPTIRRDGDAFCAISGTDPVKDVFGCGCTPEEAMVDFEADYQLKQKEKWRSRFVLLALLFVPTLVLAIIGKRR